MNGIDGWRRGWSGVLLVVVVGAPAAASWHGLTGAGEQVLGLHGAWSWLVPLTLDAGGAFAALLALRDVEAGDAAGVNRLLVAAYACGSALLNWWFASRTGGAPAGAFFAAASLSAVALWDRSLRAIRRNVLRSRGAVAVPSPRFRVGRWAVAPGETWRAWRVAVLENVSDPTEAVRLARAVESGASVEQARIPELAELPSKAAAVRYALAECEAADPRAIAEWVTERGFPTDAHYVRDVVRRDRESRQKQPGKALTVAPIRRDAS